MKVKALKELLDKFPEDYDVNLSRYIYLEGDDENDEEVYMVRLDHPIEAVVEHAEHDEVCFVLLGKDVAEEEFDNVKDITKL